MCMNYLYWYSEKNRRPTFIKIILMVVDKGTAQTVGLYIGLPRETDLQVTRRPMIPASIGRCYM